MVRLILIVALCDFCRCGFAHTDHHHQEESDSADPPPVKIAAEKMEALKEINQFYKQEILPLFKRGCFDCHSDEMNEPWYFSLPIARQIVENDIKEAQKHIKFKDMLPFESHASTIDDSKKSPVVHQRRYDAPFFISFSS